MNYNNKKKIFFISTPIYYPNSNLHLGHAYTTILADILNRYKKLDGYQTYFLTGSDEHGEKIQKKAYKENMSPIEYTNFIIKNMKKLWKLLEINYDKFIRTTSIIHKNSVNKIFNILYNNNDIYKGFYEGLYCINCEEFLKKFQLNTKNNKCLICFGTPKLIKEETYFFNISKYSNFLLNYYNNNPDFIEPLFIKNEIINNFINPGLSDLSITRTTFDWGIKLKKDHKHIIYVWFDALLSYITSLGYLTNNNLLFKKFWNNNAEIVQLIGKEIARFHLIYWPSILKSLNIRQPNKIISHGWILFNNTKMSKSIGNIVDPIFLIKRYGSDFLRFYLSYEIPMNTDGKFNYKIYLESYNTNLVNNISNLVFRTTNMINKYFNGFLKKNIITNNLFLNKIFEYINIYKKYMNEYNISKAISIILELCNYSNKFIEDIKPWNLKKNNLINKLLEVLSLLTYSINVIAFLFSPILIKTSKKILNNFNIELNSLNFLNIKKYEFIFNNKKILNKKILFKRINILKELKNIKI